MRGIKKLKLGGRGLIQIWKGGHIKISEIDKECAVATWH